MVISDINIMGGADFPRRCIEVISNPLKDQKLLIP